MSAINLTAVLNSAGNAGTVNIDAANKKTESKTTSLGFLEDANLTVTEGAEGFAKLREIIQPRLKAMLNSLPQGSEGLMMVLDTLHKTDNAIIQNMKLTEKQQQAMRERLAKQRELMQRLQEQKEDAAQVLVDFKNAFVDAQDAKLYEVKAAQENPIKA